MWAGHWIKFGWEGNRPNGHACWGNGWGDPHSCEYSMLSRLDPVSRTLHPVHVFRHPLVPLPKPRYSPSPGSRVWGQDLGLGPRVQAPPGASARAQVQRKPTHPQAHLQEHTCTHVGRARSCVMPAGAQETQCGGRTSLQSVAKCMWGSGAGQARTRRQLSSTNHGLRNWPRKLLGV